MQMSYNNYLDGDAAYTAVCDIPQPACVVVKHTNPCGAATREDLLEAYRLAVRADPTSAFGGIVAFNRWAFAWLFLSLPSAPQGARPVYLCGNRLATLRNVASLREVSRPISSLLLTLQCPS